MNLEWYSYLNCWMGSVIVLWHTYCAFRGHEETAEHVRTGLGLFPTDLHGFPTDLSLEIGCHRNQIGCD